MKCVTAILAPDCKDDETAIGLAYRINKTTWFCREHQDYETIVVVHATGGDPVTIQSVCCDNMKEFLISKGIIKPDR